MKRQGILRGVCLCVFFLLFHQAHAQESKYILDVTFSTAKEGEPISVSAHFTQSAQVVRARIMFRRFGESEYRNVEMILSGTVAVGSIPSKVSSPPYLEYYIEALTPGGVLTYPEENPRENPLRISVEGVDPRDSEVRMLSPEPGEVVAAEDLVVAVSLLYTSDLVDKRRTRLYLDGIEVTSEAVLSDDVLLYNPALFGRTLQAGTHSIAVQLYDTLGRVYHTKSTNFTLATASAIVERESALRTIGSAQLEVRNEKIDSKSTSYLRGDVQFGATYRSIAGNVDIHLTNEEKPTLQPQNRFLSSLKFGEYAKLQVGDAYPAFPSLFISGKRVRGVTGSLTLGFFNLDVSYGQTERKIEGTMIKDTTYADTSAASSRPKESLPLGGLTYRLFEAGTFTRTMLAVRPSFGSGENFQIGFTVVKAKDDIQSIRYGVYPKENIVAGTDLTLAFADQRVKWTTQIAFSLTNTDISSGNLSDAAIDSIKGVYDTTKTQAEIETAKKEADDLKKIASIGRSFITINEYLTPLDPITKLPSTAIESELSINVLNNFVRIVGFRRGKSYVSFGNEFIQTDIEGINVSDRIRLWQNRVLLSVAYETKANNTLHNSAIPTTKYNTLSTSVTVFPGAMYPTISAGYGYYTRKNNVDLSAYYRTGKPILLQSYLPTDAGQAALYSTLYAVVPDDQAVSTADEKTDRFFVALNYDFNFLERQSLSFSTAVANKTDNTFYKRNQKNTTITGSLTTRYRIPLQTTVGITMSKNSTFLAQRDSARAYIPTTTETPFNYQTVTLNARYRLFDNKLNLIATCAPSFGDFQRLLIQGGAEYEVRDNHYLTAECSFIRYTGRPTDVLAGIIYRVAF